MSMLSIFAMAGIVFFSRYIFLDPRVPIKLNARAQRLLNYSGPTVLIALSAPIIFAPKGYFSFNLDNPYLLGALATALLIWKTRSVLLTILVSMGIFLLLNTVILK